MKKIWNIPYSDWAWLFALTLWRVFVSQRHGLGVDEAHYALYGLNLDWSYFDHPPLIGWTQYLFSFFGRSELPVRLPAIISALITSILIYNFTFKITKSDMASRWATLGYNVSFLPSAMGLMFLPDTLLFIFVLWLLFICDRLLNREKFTDWIELGLCLGLAGLTKYTAVFLVFSLLGILITDRAWTKIKIPGLAAAAAIALIIVSPVFYWNFKHHWISFAYQQNHVMGSTRLSPEKIGVFLVGQILAYSPFAIFAGARGLVVSRKDWSKDVRNALWLAFPTLLFFAYTSLKDEVLPHWTLMAWGLIIPVGISLGISRGISLKWPVILSGLILLFVMAELSFSFLKFPPYQSPYADLTGWRELHDAIRPLLSKEKPGTYSIGVTNWTHGSRAKFYLEDLAQIFVLDDRYDQFDLWEEKQKKTPNLLVLSWKGFDLSKTEQEKCKSMEPVTEKVFEVNGAPVNSLKIFWCRGHSW